MQRGCVRRADERAPAPLQGDVICILDQAPPKTDAGWWLAQCGSKRGLVPRCVLAGAAACGAVRPWRTDTLPACSNYVGEHTSEIENPVHEAAKRGNIPFLDELLSASVTYAATDAHAKHARAGLTRCLAALESVNGLDKSGSTPLHWAASGGRYTPAPRRPGHRSGCAGMRGGSVHLSGGQPALRGPARACRIGSRAAAEQAATPLHQAAWKGRAECVARLLAAGARKDLRNSAGQLPFDVRAAAWMPRRTRPAVG